MDKLIAQLQDDYDVTDVYSNGTNIYRDEDGRRITLNKATVGLWVSMVWDEDLIYVETEEKDNKFIATKVIPIYDGVCLVLKGYGESEEAAEKDVNDLYNDLLSAYKKYEDNENRNEKNFMSKVHRFAYIPNDRKFCELDSEDLPEGEIVYFDDSDVGIRELIISAGVPSDARADEPIWGYVNGNDLIITKSMFIKGYKDVLSEFITGHHKEIAEHYGLKEYNVYKQAIAPITFAFDDDNVIIEKYITEDYDYYIPNKQVKI